MLDFGRQIWRAAYKVVFSRSAGGGRPPRTGSVDFDPGIPQMKPGAVPGHHR